MRVLIYEYVTGGGLLNRHAGELESLRPEGEAMATAVAAGFAAVAGVEVHLLRDVRLPPPAVSVTLHQLARPEDEFTVLSTLAACCDWTLLIAPEVDDILRTRARLVEEVGARLLSPSSSVIELCADKRTTTAFLREAGVPAPRSIELFADDDGVAQLSASMPLPAVVKLLDGAGALGTRRVENSTAHVELGPGRWMLEEFVPGLAVSAAVLCGPGGHVVLPPFVQQLDERTFCYLGGSRLMDQAQQERARHWAAQAAGALPEPLGYIGVDLVLGADPSGDEDAVIEINPRLTTSIVGLGAIARTNLAAAMLAVAEGWRHEPEFVDEEIWFFADGGVSLSA